MLIRVVIQAFWPIGLEDLIGSFGWCRHILEKGKRFYCVDGDWKGRYFQWCAPTSLFVSLLFYLVLKSHPSHLLFMVLSFTMCPKPFQRIHRLSFKKTYLSLGKKLYKVRDHLSPSHVGSEKESRISMLMISSSMICLLSGLQHNGAGEKRQFLLQPSLLAL